MASPRVIRPDSAPPGSDRGPLQLRQPPRQPRSLGEALRAAGISLDGPSTGSETPSEEDYDENVRPSLSAEPRVVRRRPHPASSSSTSPELSPRIVRHDSGVHIVMDDDKSLQQILQNRARDPTPQRRKRKFSDMVFTRQFSAFDRQNLSSVNSPFHGFYVLFWLAVGLFMLKISAINWKTYGSILGTSDIMKTMFSRDGKSMKGPSQVYSANSHQYLCYCYRMESCVVSLESVGSSKNSSSTTSSTGTAQDGSSKTSGKPSS